MPPTSSGGEDTQFQVERSLIDRIKHQYPRLVSIVSQFRKDPFSGDTLRRILGKDPSSKSNPDVVSSLSPPQMWQHNAPVVISQYADYTANRLPTYWNAVVSDLREQYGSVIRYEHHDAPPLRQTSERYNIATIGRALQDHAGDEAFWIWFNTIMMDGVESVNEAGDIIRDIDIDANVDFDFLERAVDESLYHPILENDVNMLFSSVDDQTLTELQEAYDQNEPVFVLFVNGRIVQPNYNSIVGAVEDVLSSRSRDQNTSTRRTQQPSSTQQNTQPVNSNSGTEEWTGIDNS